MREEQRKALGLPEAVKLLPVAPEDAAAASQVAFATSGSFESNWKRRRQAIQTQSIFGPGQKQKATSAHTVELARKAARGTAAKRKTVGELAATAAKRQRV